MISILCLHGGAATNAIRSLIARNSREAGSATTNANITAAEKIRAKVNSVINYIQFLMIY
jgi:hypothetical protein